MSQEERDRRLGISHMTHKEQLEYLTKMNAETDRKEAEARAAKNARLAAQQAQQQQI